MVRSNWERNLNSILDSFTFWMLEKNKEWECWNWDWCSVFQWRFILYQGWRSQKVKRRSIYEGSFRKMKIFPVSWKVKKEKTSQNDFAVTDKHLSLLLSEEKVSRDAHLQLRFTWAYNSFSYCTEKTINICLMLTVTHRLWRSIAACQSAWWQLGCIKQQYPDDTVGKVTACICRYSWWKPRLSLPHVCLVLLDCKIFRKASNNCCRFLQPGLVIFLSQHRQEAQHCPVPFSEGVKGAWEPTCHVSAHLLFRWGF